MRIRPHHHPCQHCQSAVECDGDLEQNPDGWPDVLCRAYDLRTLVDVFCETCAAKYLLGTCDDCGAWVGEPHDETCHPGLMHAPNEVKA